MENIIEKRNFPRLQKSFPVRFNLEQPSSSFEAITDNLSQGGMRLKANLDEQFPALAPKERLNLEFRVPAAEDPLKMKAQIIWIDKPSFGIQFIQISTFQQNRLSSYIKEASTSLVEIEAQTLIDEFVEVMREEANRQKTSTLTFGWLYTYVPEEIIYAAGFVPYRIMGKVGPVVKARATLSGNVNPFVLSCLESALDGEYESFAGVVMGCADDASRGLCDVWKKYVKSSFIHILDMPKATEPISIDKYKMELAFFAERLEEHFKIKITSESLKKAIALCNETRQLLISLQILRKSQESLISSNQFLAITLASMTVSKEFFNPHLEVLLGQLKSLPLRDNLLPSDFEIMGKPRLLLTGSFQNNSLLAELIEQAGGILVCEDMCTGLRYFTDLVDTTIDDLLLALAKRYLTKTPGAIMLNLKRRFEYIESLIREYKIDGLIYYMLKFDDHYLFEFPEMKRWLQSKKVPILLLESDHRFATLGQFSTRIQAFIEALSLKWDV